MKPTLKHVTPIVVALLVIVECSDRQSIGPPPNLEFVDTPTDDYEAETAAYFLAETRLAPKYLYEEIRAELELIRSQHDSIPGVSVKYSPWANPSYLTMRFDSAVTDSIQRGGYHAWDDLNAACMLDTFDIWREYVQVYYKGVQNPIRLLDIYKSLPGLGYASTSGRMGDAPVLVMRREGQSIKYFFREAWGDCPSGCIHSRFSYFTVSGGEATYHGSYQPEYNDSTALPPPAWADTAWQTLRDYHQYASWTRDTL
jgi:hypothetical protein